MDNHQLTNTKISPALLARGLKPYPELARNKPCGTRTRYIAGCRCEACRRANTLHARERAAARARGETNGLVSSERVRAHLQLLSSRGVGYKTVADSALVATSVVARIAQGQALHVREQTARRILAVTEAAAADKAVIPGAPTWKLLDELLACGYTKTRIATELAGKPVRVLQIKRDAVTVRTAALAKRVYERLAYASAADTRVALRQLEWLRAEGFRLDRVRRELAALAQRRGWPEPTLQPAAKGARAGCLRQQEVLLVAEVYQALMGDEEV